MAGFWGGLLDREIRRNADGDFVIEPVGERQFPILVQVTDLPKEHLNWTHSDLTSNSP